jgi:hypothetical protein
MSAASTATMMLLHKQGTPALLLPEFLKEVFVGQRTGLLHVTHSESAAVSFRSVNGQLVSGSSSDERGRLGETLVRRGLISRADLERALSIVSQHGRRLAPVLRELDMVDTPRLEQALALHIHEMLVMALGWDKAALLFEDQELPDAPAEDLTLRCSTAELILDIVRRIPAPVTVRRGLGSLDRVVVAVDNPQFRMERLTLTAADGYILARADGSTTARSMFQASTLPAQDLERSLLGLLCTGVVRYQPAAPKPALTLSPPPLPSRRAR